MDFFYDNLAPYGSWRDVGDYGYCWQPFDVDSQWQPYSDGRWVFTDAGWTWDSYEPYGWAVYHYGRWANVIDVGWVWVPGTEWGPGWVSWRHSQRYVGWAPLPPEAQFLRAIGFSVWVDEYYDIGPGNFRFVENRDFGAQRLNTVFIDRRQNIEIIHQTTNITNITYVNNIIYNGGLEYNEQSQRSASPILRYRLDRRQDFEGDRRHQTAEHLRSRVNGDSLSVIALPFSRHASAPPSKLAERVGRAEINHGWRGAGSPDEVSALRERMKSKAGVPDKLPAQPQFQRPEIPRTPRVADPRMKPVDPSSKAKPTRDAPPRRVDAPPKAPEKKLPPKADRPPSTVPEAKRTPPTGIPRRSELPSASGKDRMRDPRAPGPANVPQPPKVREPERKKVLPPQQRTQPPARPEGVKPGQAPRVAPKPPNLPPDKRPRSVTPKPTPAAPKARVAPSPVSPPPKPSASKSPSRGKPHGDDRSGAKGRKKPSDEPK